MPDNNEAFEIDNYPELVVETEFLAMAPVFPEPDSLHDTQATLNPVLVEPPNKDEVREIIPAAPSVTLRRTFESKGTLPDFQIPSEPRSLRALADATGRNYELIESDLSLSEPEPDTKPFGLREPTLRWQADGHRYALFIVNTNKEQFLTEMKLGLALHNDGHYELTHSDPSPFDVLITQESALGGAIYPFLEQTNRAWSVVSSRIDKPVAYPRSGTFQMIRPTLRWVKDNKVEDLFVDGLTTEDFLGRIGLQLSLDKGGFVLSKRLSRVMRPHFAYGFFPEQSVHIRYLKQTETEQKIWDGAGVISRSMLRRLMMPEQVTPAKRAEIEREIRTCQRVEFTILSANGQDKGHAIVSEDLGEDDFLLPIDTKKEVKLVNGQTFVGVNFVHAHDSMRLDVQSLINLYPFFDETQLGRWLDEEGDLFIQAVETGQVDAALQRIDEYATLDDIEAWSLREYFASGGHAMWFATPARNLLNQHLKRLNETTLQKMRLPVPGGRYYVMPIAVGQAAGVDQVVPRGQIRIDHEYGTAWVNDEDWVQLEGSDQGIRNILGGADNDDALWLHPFTDYDGVQKVLAWRSPNQPGEYIILQPTMGSHFPEWKTVAGSVQMPDGDSRKLFARTDTVTREYLNLVKAPETPTKGQPYAIETMGKTIERANANAAGLGLYCNLLMISKGLYGTLPRQPPAPLEDIIDATVKTGADVSAVRQWCFEASQRIAVSGIEVPELLVGRLAIRDEQRKLIKRTTDHWTDRLHTILTTHIENFRAQRNDLVARVAPPSALFDAAFNREDRSALALGKQFNSLYAKTRAALLHQKKSAEMLTDADSEQIRQTMEVYLNQFSTDRQPAILRAALVEAHLSDSHSDGAVWLIGQKTDSGHAPGLAQQTLRALREIGVLDEVAEVDGKVVVYPGSTIREPDFKGTIGLNGVWFNYYKQQQSANGRAVPTAQRDVPRDTIKRTKAIIEQLAAKDWQGLPLIIQREEDRLKAYYPDGELFGFVSKDSEPYLTEGLLQLDYILVADGNLRAVWNYPTP